MFKNINLNVGSNEEVSAASIITLNGYNIEQYEKQEIVTNIKFESILASIKNYIFHQHMVNFLNKIQLSDQKYQTNRNIREKNYKGKFLFPMK